MAHIQIKTTKKQIEQACEFVRKKILSGELSADGELPAIRKLAEQTGLQRNTIWRALLSLKEERLVVSTPTGRYQVHPRFRTNNQGTQTLKTVFVGAGDTALSNPFIQRVYDALAGNQDGFNIELSLHMGTDSEKVSLDALRGYDAVILSVSWSYYYFQQLKESNKLVTSLTAPLSYHLPCDVRIDNHHGGEIAGKAFCKQPIQKAVLLGESLGYPNHWHEDFELRVLGFRRAWLQNGRNSLDVKECPLPEDIVSCLSDLEKIVSEQQEFVGYFALSDAVALLLLRVLHDRGLRVPEDALIIGFDDSPAAAEAGLASLHPDPEHMAEKLILQLRTQETDQDYQEIIYVKPLLVERASLGNTP